MRLLRHQNNTKSNLGKSGSGTVHSHNFHKNTSWRKNILKIAEPLEVSKHISRNWKNGAHLTRQNWLSLTQTGYRYLASSYSSMFSLLNVFAACFTFRRVPVTAWMLITVLLLELTYGVDFNGISPVCPCRDFCPWVLLKTLESSFESVFLELGV